MRIRKDDLVEVITGEQSERGRARRVVRVLPDKKRIVVEGVNLVYKHLKPSRRNPQGGRLSKEAPIDASNVLPYCKVCSRGVRIGATYDEADGHKYLYCKACKKSGKTTVMRRLSPPRKKYVQQGK